MDRIPEEFDINNEMVNSQLRTGHGLDREIRVTMAFCGFFNSATCRPRSERVRDCKLDLD